jgi:hypothetical protein
VAWIEIDKRSKRASPGERQRSSGLAVIRVREADHRLAAGHRARNLGRSLDSLGTGHARHYCRVFDRHKIRQPLASLAPSTAAYVPTGMNELVNLAVHGSIDDWVSVAEIDRAAAARRIKPPSSVFGGEPAALGRRVDHAPVRVTDRRGGPTFSTE